MLNGISHAIKKTSNVDLAGYPITYAHSEDLKTHQFVNDLGQGESISLKTFKDLVSIKMSEVSKDRFGGSLGLMG